MKKLLIVALCLYITTTMMASEKSSAAPSLKTKKIQAFASASIKLEKMLKKNCPYRNSPNDDSILTKYIKAYEDLNSCGKSKNRRRNKIKMRDIQYLNYVNAKFYLKADSDSDMSDSDVMVSEQKCEELEPEEFATKTQALVANFMKLEQAVTQKQYPVNLGTIEKYFKAYQELDAHNKLKKNKPNKRHRESIQRRAWTYEAIKYHYDNLGRFREFPF
jgi:hypothetical protein